MKTHGRRLIVCWVFLLKILIATAEFSVDNFLSLGDEALQDDELEKALRLYEQGISKVKSTSHLPTVISLYTNFATTLSAIGRNLDAADHYEMALLIYADRSQELQNDDTSTDDAKRIAAASSFYLGMVYQDIGQVQNAIKAYSYSHNLDPLHWASLANLGSIYYDSMKNYEAALLAFNAALSLLSSSDLEPTDPPAEPRFILSQIQYRIGLCLSHDIHRKCFLDNDPDKKVIACSELAANAFLLAIEYDPENSQAAKHMLATITADATLKRASNEYVKSLFDDYAHNFEESLVKDLGYNGYERLRQGFDQAFGGVKNVPSFDVTIDAGCGTGLVGEQFRNISKTLIGVDLSEEILKKAVETRPKLYDLVLAADVTEVFRSRRPINLIVGGDSFIYFGDLGPLLSAAFDGLVVKGYIAFTLENVGEDDEKILTETKSDWRWQLTASGRFTHRVDYVVQIAQDSGFLLIHYEPLDGFRFERGQKVRGHLFVMQKTSRRKDEL
jgi:predicted TPR repeat methyltransferase